MQLKIKKKKKQVYRKIIYTYGSRYLLCLFLIGCGTQIPVASKHYRKDLLLTVNGKQIKGMGVAPSAKSYKIHIKAHAKLDYLAIETCHRSESLESPSYKPRVIKKRKEYEYNYVPVGLERNCAVSFTVYNKRGEDSWGYIGFESLDYTLPARIECNGGVVKGNGNSSCHSKAGLHQRITFDRVVKVIEDADCGLSAGKNGSWQFQQPLGAKVCIFMSKDKQFHKLRLFGYNGVILQED